MSMGNTLILSYVKNETDITVYTYNELSDPLSRRKIGYIDYINALAKRYTEHHRASQKGW